MGTDLRPKSAYVHVNIIYHVMESSAISFQSLMFLFLKLANEIAVL
jgi:hypothetical protein